MIHVLAINAGSSVVKFAVFTADHDLAEILRGHVDGKIRIVGRKTALVPLSQLRSDDRVSGDFDDLSLNQRRLL